MERGSLVGIKTQGDLTKVIREVNSFILNPVGQRGRWTGRQPKKGICEEIYFKIASFDAPSRTALGELMGCDDGYELVDVQGQIAPDILVVEVYDYLGCIFDEPSSELFNRMGIARWGRVKVGSYLLPSQWIVQTLCCKNPACEV